MTCLAYIAFSFMSCLAYITFSLVTCLAYIPFGFVNSLACLTASLFNGCYSVSKRVRAVDCAANRHDERNEAHAAFLSGSWRNSKLFWLYRRATSILKDSAHQNRSNR